MGRHSASTDDDEEDVAAVATAPSSRSGRHARGDEEAETSTGPVAGAPVVAALAEDATIRIPPVEKRLGVAGAADPVVAQDVTDTAPLPMPAASAAAAAGPEADAEGEPARTAEPAGTAQAAEVAPAPAAKKRTHSTSADLALIRAHSEVRNRCIAAVIVPFVLYTAVLAAIGSMDVYLLWIWIPTVSAGILAGAFLDLAHRRYDAPPEPPIT